MGARVSTCFSRDAEHDMQTGEVKAVAAEVAPSKEVKAVATEVARSEASTATPADSPLATPADSPRPSPDLKPVAEPIAIPEHLPSPTLIEKAQDGGEAQTDTEKVSPPFEEQVLAQDCVIVPFAEVENAAVPSDPEIKQQACNTAAAGAETEELDSAPAEEAAEAILPPGQETEEQGGIVAAAEVKQREAAGIEADEVDIAPAGEAVEAILPSEHETEKQSDNVAAAEVKQQDAAGIEAEEVDVAPTGEAVEAILPSGQETDEQGGLVAAAEVKGHDSDSAVGKVAATNAHNKKRGKNGMDKKHGKNSADHSRLPAGAPLPKVATDPVAASSMGSIKRKNH